MNAAQTNTASETLSTRQTEQLYSESAIECGLDSGEWGRF